MTNNEDIIIRFRDIHKSFGDNNVLRGVNLDIYRGETITVMGGSGTGKSVLLKNLIGLLIPDKGQIFVEEEDVVLLSERELIPIRKKIAMLFQGGALFDSMTVGENLAYPLFEHTDLGDKEIAKRVAEKLEMVDMPGVEDKMPADLSGGMKKRVGLARSIILEPEVIMYDEPTTGLDPITCVRINNLIKRMQERLGVTSIVVTHDIVSAFTVSNRIAMLYEGKILVVDTLENVKKFDNSWVQEFLRGAPEV